MLRRSVIIAPLILSASGAWAAPAKKPPPRPIFKPKLIALDPGHGGHDPGALGYRGTQEKTVVIAVARELQKQLLAGNSYRAMLTRSIDTYVPLRERVARAQDAKADLFLSIHADSHSDSEVRGASVYTLSETGSDREAALLAQKENKADVIAGLDLNRQAPDVQSILIDLAQRETTNRSRVFAGLLVQDLAKAGIPLVQRPNRSAGFAVLTATDVPAALIELGYLSNREDEKLLNRAHHRAKVAAAVVRSVNAFFAGKQGGT